MKAIQNLLVACFCLFAFVLLSTSAYGAAKTTVSGATGGSAVSADKSTETSPFTTALTGPTLATSGGATISTGTLILNAPSGFEWDVGGTAPTATVTAGTGAVSFTGRTTTQLSFNVDTVVANNSTVTFAGLRVKPTSGTLPATGNITRTGTATVTAESVPNYGTLTETGGTVTHLAFSTQPAGTAGAAFSTQPVVKTRDQFENNSATGLPAGLWVTVALTAGTGPLQGTASMNIGTSAGNGTATYASLRIDVAGADKQLTVTTTNGYSSDASSVFTVNPAAASKLVIATQPSATASAGVAFDQQPVVRIEDAYTNLRSSDTLTVTAARLAGAGTLQGTTAVAAVGGIASFSNLAHAYATNITIQFTSGSLTAATSGTIAVSPTAYSQLQVLLPGETAAPGSPTGKTGAASAQTAGTAFTVRVNAVDGNWNLINTVSDTAAITCTDPTAVLPPEAALVNGTGTFSLTCKDAGSQTVTATDVTTGSQSGTSSALTVNAGAFTKLQLLMPGETAAPGTPTGKTGTPSERTAGTAFNVIVNGVDANWNVVPAANGSAYTIRLTSSDANATLPADANLASGTQTFSVTLKTAGMATVTASDIDDGTKTPGTSPSTAVSAGAFTKLQLLVPGESGAPGTATGKTGTPTVQTPDAPLYVTVNAVDANWNLISSISDTVGITCNDANATLPANAALSTGTVTLSMQFKTVGTRTITATDLSDGTKTANTSPSITVSPGAFAKLQVLMPGEAAAPGTTTGKSGTPSAQTAGTAFNVTIRAVDGSWNLISTNDTVSLTSSDTQATLPANGALSAGSRTASVTFKTSGSQTVTAADVTHGGIGSDTGSATTVNPAAASKLVLATAPSATATAGVAFEQQPVIYIQDTYNNIRSNDTLVVTATRNAGAGTLLGATNVAAAGGVATFADLAHGYATNITIRFTSGALTAATSGIVAISPDVYSKLVVLAPGQTNAPGTPSGMGGTATAQTVGTAFAVKVLAADAYGNPIDSVSDTVAITCSDPAAVLPADAALVNGTNSFSLTCQDAGSQTVTASDVTTGTQTGTSSPITVNAGAFVKLQLLLPGETAAPGTPTGKTGTPEAQTAGTPFTVIVNGVDANWNVVPGASGGSYTIHIASSDLNATLPANANLASGTQTFSVTFKTAGSWTVTATDTDDGTKTPSTSPATQVNVGAFAKLQLLMPGETAAPGTATGKTGTPSAQNTDNPVSVTVNAVDASWNLVDSVSDTVGLTASDPNAELPPEAALSAGTQTFAVNFNTVGSRTVTATDLTDGSKTASTGTATTVSVGAFVKLQLLLPGETAAAGTPSGKTGTPSARTAGTQFAVTVNAVDAAWNLVSTVTHTVGITSSDSNATLPANNTLSGGTRNFNITLRTAGDRDIMATDITDGTKASATSPLVTVNPGTFARLQLLVPGEIAVPGSPTGKTGSPGAQTAGAPFDVTVNGVDANWNLINTNDTIRIYASDTNAVLPANAALVAGSRTFSLTLRTIPSATVTASNVTHSVITLNTSPAIPLNAAEVASVRVETKADGSGIVVPAQNVTAGSSITNYPITRDSYGNFIANVAADAWSLVNQTGGVLDSDLVPAPDAKSAVFTAHAVGTANIHVDSGSLSSIESGLLTAKVGTFAKLQLLMPGETAVAGTPSGKTGTPDAQTAGAAFTVTVNAVDPLWNLISTNDTVRIYSSDTNAVLPANAALVAGTKTFSVTLKTAGTPTVTASNFTHSVIALNTSPATTVNPDAFARLQLLVPGETAAPGSTAGKIGTPTAQTAGTAVNVSVNAVDAYWNRVPGVTDTVGMTCTDTNATLPADAALAGGTGTFALSFKTAGTRTITATDITDGAKTANTSPNITVNPGAFVKLQLLTPGETPAPGTATGKNGTPTAQTAASAFNVIVNGVDANWNIVPGANGGGYTMHLVSSDANATMPANADLASGTRTFSVTLKTAGTTTITASDVDDATKTPSTSPALTVNPGALAKLQLLVPGETAAPGTATGKTGTPSTQSAGTALDITVNAVDANWNLVPTNDTVRMTSTDANALLPADTDLTAGSRTLSVTFNTAGTRTLTAANLTHATVTANTSPNLTVSPGALVKLQLLAPGETAAPGTATGKTGTPTARTAGTAFSLTVNTVDALWNIVPTNHTVGFTSSDPNAALPANTALGTDGTRAFNVTFKTAGSHTVTTADVTDNTVASATSPTLTVNHGPFAKLQVIAPGETAAPGSPSGKTGTPTTQTVPAPISVTVNAVDANWNLIDTNDTVRISSSDTLALLPPDAALNAGSQTFALTLNSAGAITVSGSDLTHIGIATGTSSAISVNKGDQTITFDKLANKSYGDAAFAVSATASSGQPVSFSILSGPATVAGSTVTITGAGTVTVRASQAGNDNWNAAPDVDQSFSVAQVPLTATADNQTRAYGALNPPLTVTYTGFVNGDTATVLTGSPELTTLAETNSPLGDYPIEIALGTLSSDNYTFSLTNGTLTVTPAILSVSADDKTRAYGEANPELTYSYSGLVNGQDTSILSGTPEISTTADAASPAATYPITVTQGKLSVADTNYSLAFVPGTLTVTPIALTVTADPQTKIYGESDPALTYQITSGTLINGDTFTGSLSRVPGENAGSYAIEQGSLTAGDNYALTYQGASLSITPAMSALVLVSSANPSPPGSSVTFSVTLSAVAPGSGTPSGSVQFYMNDAAMGDPVSLVGGVASIATDLLPHGSNAVRVEYAGDGNFNGGSNTLIPAQVVNSPPVTRSFALGAYRNTPVSMSATKLARTATDADQDALTVTAVTSPTAEGGTVVLAGATITYTPPTDYTGPDSFTYTVSDGFEPVSGTVDVTVSYANASSTIDNLVTLPDGNKQISASGIPDYNYDIQATTTPAVPGSWSTIGSRTANSTGIIVYDDLDATNHTSRFYRLAAP
jgi:hypothetical protein